MLARFFTVQLMVQLGTAVAGVAIVRLLTKSDYAYYSVVTSLLFSAAALTDCGVSIALTALGGRVWQDNEALGSLIASAVTVRKWFVAAVIVGSLVIVPPLLWRNGAHFIQDLSLTGTVVVSLLLQFAIGLYGIVPKLRANYRLLENTAMLGIAVRLGFVGLMYLCLADSVMAMLGNCAAFGVQLWIYRRYAAREVNLRAGVDRNLVSEIIAIVRKQVPYELYGAMSGQLSVLLISIFGDSGRVAEVGALGRLALIFTAMSGVLSNVLLPRFARCQDPRRLKELFAGILFTYSTAVSSILLIAWLFPHQVISILGRNYANLQGECFLALAGSVLGAILGAVWGLNICRGWITPAWVGLTITIAVQICCIVVFDIRTVHGVLLMTLTTNIVGLLGNLVASGYFLYINERRLVATAV